MENATHKVNDENMPMVWAVKKRRAPQSTLHDQISGKVSHGDKPGPKPLLTAAEESEFVDFLVELDMVKNLLNHPCFVPLTFVYCNSTCNFSLLSLLLLWQPYLSYHRADPTG